MHTFPVLYTPFSNLKLCPCHKKNIDKNCSSSTKFLFYNFEISGLTIKILKYYKKEKITELDSWQTFAAN